MSTLVLISLLVLAINIPFGYWRSNVKAYSLQWFLAIHIPVPFIIVLRLVSEIGFAWHTYLLLVTAFFLGQKTGSVVMKRLHKACQHASSCLVMDLMRCIRS